MGIHLYTYIDPPGIDPGAWATAYDDSLRLLRAFPGGLMRLVRHSVANHSVFAYSPHIEETVDGRRNWKVEGDRRSLRHAESHQLMRDLECYGGSGEPMRDILIDFKRAVCASVAKTQGEPYHLPLLAVAMMLEDRFPRSAIVTGDLHEAHACEAAAYAEGVLGYRPAMPIVLDANRLRERLLPMLPKHRVSAAVEDFSVPKSSAALRDFSREYLTRWQRAEDGLDEPSLEDLAASGTPQTLTASQRMAIEALVLLAARSRNEACRIDPPPTSTLESLAQVVSKRRLVFTIETWEALAREPDDLRALLTSLVLLMDGALTPHLICRALFENAALRHYAAEIARDDASLARIEQQVMSLVGRA